MTKRCPKCKLIKDKLAFYKIKTGLKSWCKICETKAVSKHYRKNRVRLIAEAKEWQKNNRTLYLKIKRASSLKKNYGLTIADWNKLYKAQNKSCAICRTKVNNGKRLAVDHNHKTGKVRGLLCTQCNQGIGKFRDDIVLLEKAINYLDKE